MIKQKTTQKAANTKSICLLLIYCASKKMSEEIPSTLHFIKIPTLCLTTGKCPSLGSNCNVYVTFRYTPNFIVLYNYTSF